MSLSKRLHIVLHQPEIPQNTGNIGRTCVAIDAKLWLVRPLGFQVDTHQVRRAGLDYWPHLTLQIVDSWNDLLTHLTETRIWLFSRGATQKYSDVRYAAGDALVFGCESAGLPSDIREAYAGQLVRIPTTGQVRSLNLSNAVAVGAYEVARQLSWF